MTRMSPIFWLRISSCRPIASVTWSKVAWCCSISTSPILGPISKPTYAPFGTNMRLTLPSLSTGGNRNRPNSVSTCPIVSPRCSPPSTRWMRYGLAWRCRSSLACGSASCIGNGNRGVVSVSERNWSKRKATVVRAGGICTWAIPFSGTKKVSRPDATFSSSPMTIWQGRVSVCSVGAG